MNKYIRSIAVSLAAATAVHAAPFLAVGDGAELFLTGTLGVRADDNIFLAQNEVDDLIFDITPGVELVFGKGSVTQGALSIKESFSNYADNDQLNTSLSSISFFSKYNDGKSKFDTNASFNQLNQNTPDVVGLTRRDVLALGLNAEISLTEKSSIGFGASYDDTDYKRTGYSDLRTMTLPVDYYWEMTPKVDLSLGFRYRDTEVQTGLDSEDYFYRVGFRGEFTPKVTGSVKVGIGQREFATGGSEDLLDLDAMLDLAVSAKSTLRLTASNDFGVSGAGQQQKNFSLGGSLINQVSDVLTVRSSVSFRKIDYYTREDDFVELQVGADYKVSENVFITGAIAYRSNDSSVADFTNTVLSLAANFRY
jgi:hypothetical protein